MAQQDSLEIHHRVVRKKQERGRQGEPEKNHVYVKTTSGSQRK